MAITPEDAIKQGRETFLRKVLSVEDRIHVALVAEAFKGRGVRVDFFMNTPEHDVLNEALRRYREAGWAVEQAGSAYVFTSAPATT